MSLFAIHDAPARLNTSPGQAAIEFELVGDTAEFRVKDDVTNALNPNDLYTVKDGDPQFTTSHEWEGCCTDGFVIGSLDNDWLMLGGFKSSDFLNGWIAVSGNNSTLSFALETGRRVRFQSISVPEPTSLALLSLGLAGLRFAARKK